MNFGVAIQALEFAIQHGPEIAADLECAVHLLRRVEHACVRHKTTADTVLVAADHALEKLAKAGTHPPK